MLVLALVLVPVFDLLPVLVVVSFLFLFLFYSCSCSRLHSLLRLYFLSGAVALVLPSRARFPFAELDVQVQLFLHAVAVPAFVVVGCGVRC